MNRAEYENKLIAKNGKTFLKKSKELLDAQWDYIDSLGDPEKASGKDREDLVISESN
jgi:hypothetical protein